jgi:hypothetical protein
MNAKTASVCVILLTLASEAFCDEPLPDTKSLQWEEADLSERLMGAAHAFVERKIRDASAKRRAFWKYDLSSPAALDASMAKNRHELRKILGMVDERLEARMERYGDDFNPSLVAEREDTACIKSAGPCLMVSSVKVCSCSLEAIRSAMSL